MTRDLRLRASLPLCLLLALACGGESPEPAVEEAPGPGGLTAVELEQGIGPVRDMELAPLDAALASEGEAAFTTKCSACHRIDERFVAPELGHVLERRSPEFVMNMILNAAEMVQRHPEVQKLLAEFYTPMPVQVRDHDEARAILEYLRSVQIEGTSTPSGSAGGL